MFDFAQGLVLTVLAVAFVIVKTWAFVDCLTRPKEAFPAAGRRTWSLWALLTGLAAVTALVTSPIGIFGLAGLIVALVYLLDVRVRVREVTGSRR
jgi:hypothetical protein